jgi:signal recognition particle GTPase
MVISSLTNVFENIRTQSDEKNKHIAQMKRNYIDLLTRADERFYLVKKFQNEYNKFYD